jgi:hypothetical protein
MTVECSNCGGLESPELWVAAAALVVALSSAWWAWRSAKAADKSVALAAEEVAMAKEQHKAFMRELRARARIRIDLSTYPEPDEDGVIRNDGTMVGLRLGIGLKNEGDREAREVVLNVIVPAVYRDFRWCGPNGEQVEHAHPPVPTPEQMVDAEGRSYPAHYLSRTIDVLSRRSPLQAWATFHVDVPRHGQSPETSIPVRVTAESDDLSDDEPEASESLMIRLAPR